MIKFKPVCVCVCVCVKKINDKNKLLLLKSNKFLFAIFPRLM